MSFLDIRDPAERANLVKEYVTAMKTVKQRNMVNREMKLAIGYELPTLFHPIVNATKEEDEETRKELAPMKKTLTDSLNRAAGASKPSGPRVKNVDNTFGIYRRKDGQLQVGSILVETSGDGTTLKVDDTEYELTPGLYALIMQKHPLRAQYNDNDLEEYGNLVRQIEDKSFPNPNVKGDSDPRDTWKYTHILQNISEDADDTDSVESDTASIGDTEPSDTDASLDPGLASPASTRRAFENVPSSSDFPQPSPSPVRTRAFGKAKKAKERKHPYEGHGVVYLPGDINELTKKLHLLVAEFFAGNITVRNELVHVLDVLRRLKQLTRKEYTDITARLAASL